MSDLPPTVGNLPAQKTSKDAAATETSFGAKTEAQAPATVDEGKAAASPAASATQGEMGVDTVGVLPQTTDEPTPARVYKRVHENRAPARAPLTGLRRPKKVLNIGALGETVQLSLGIQDLSRDEFIVNAPRTQIEGQAVPSLGGIPLLHKLGQGGMGAVYYGVHPGFGREVAIKVLPFHLAQKDPDLIQRFFREARMAATVNSAHLVSVTDVAQECGISYLVMEFVSGKSAAQELKLHRLCGAVGVAERSALEICIAACEGLSAAHDANIVHRDIKPDNILVPYKKGTTELDFTAAKLADLGLARSEEFNQSLTSSQHCMGTPGFMSPEQIEDTHSVGRPADVFSLGAALYALLCGEAPFSGDGAMQIFRNTSIVPHVPVRSRRIDVSKSTAAVVDVCLAKDADNRYQDGAALLKALKACLTALSNPQAAHYQDLHGPPPVSEDAKPEPVSLSYTPAARPLRAWFAVAGAAAVALAAAAYWLSPVASEGIHPNSAPRFDPEIMDAQESDFDRQIVEKNRIEQQGLAPMNKKLEDIVKARDAEESKRRVEAAARAEFEDVVEKARSAGKQQQFDQARALLELALASPGAALSSKREEALAMLEQLKRLSTGK